MDTFFSSHLDGNSSEYCKECQIRGASYSATFVSIAGRTVLIGAEDDDGGNGVADSEASASGIVIDGA